MKWLIIDNVTIVMTDFQLDGLFEATLIEKEHVT